MKKIPYTEESPIYKPEDIALVLQEAVNEKNLRGTNKQIYYYDIPCAFDIETTSFYKRGLATYDYDQYSRLKQDNVSLTFEKCALMYVWQLGINGRVIVGRTWEDFQDVMTVVCANLGLGESRRLIVYVHNLAYEFQFIRLLFEWDKVFSIDERKPIYAVTKTGIEFRCSYILTGYSLAKVGEHLQHYKVKKLVGELDYTKVRHSGTPLTPEELAYCVNDIRVVMACIQEKIEQEGGITNIPLTKTGYVRKYSRKECLTYLGEDGKRRRNFRYIDLMAYLQIQDLGEFMALQRAFQGGFTHANGNHVGQIIDNIASYDFTSSYPYAMVSELYPMSKGVKVKITSADQFEDYINKYCCVFDVRFTGLVCKQANECPLSLSKCFEHTGVVENNGRVFAADDVLTTTTDVDYKVLKAFYSWSSMTVYTMWLYKRGRLPTEFVKAILTLYKGKTTLKGVAGKEVEYLASKEQLNACYGMTVTNPLRDEFTYINDVWGLHELSHPEMEESLYKYNNSRSRFLFYPWGVFVTAYARRNLFTAIYSLGDDYIYSDTDSVKVKNYQAHAAYFEAYNKAVQAKLHAASEYHNIPFEHFAPSTIKGVTKTLGVWDFEGVYKRFKTLGAKRYMVETSDGFSLTVSGLDKRTAIPYLCRTYGKDVMKHFTDYLYIPPEGTGKNVHTYIDYPIQGTLTDYLGNTAKYTAKTGIHLEPTDYTLNLSVQFLEFLRGHHLKA